MIELIKYRDEYCDITAIAIAKFFGFHRKLCGDPESVSDTEILTAKENIPAWTADDNDLYIIKYNGSIVGFIHIGYRGGNVAWIEDIYVDESYRHLGIATETISAAEAKIKNKPGYTAVCMDVVPRNYSALKLYYNLGYDSLSTITVRKELYLSTYDKEVELFGFTFKY